MVDIIPNNLFFKIPSTLPYATKTKYFHNLSKKNLYHLLLCEKEWECWEQRNEEIKNINKEWE